ncbi:hypothetical protein IFM89_025645 [Coptis chinensis]|uniref:Uncharacterized protein n=1 Tax=Coptis chinensis TaxID=261450 RepID=A0A835HYH0_9MAGN|nr:hypothetical protein IFM89_025645 [Coptis chinensis]
MRLLQGNLDVMKSYLTRSTQSFWIVLLMALYLVDRWFTNGDTKMSSPNLTELKPGPGAERIQRLIMDLLSAKDIDAKSLMNATLNMVWRRANGLMSSDKSETSKLKTKLYGTENKPGLRSKYEIVLDQLENARTEVKTLKSRLDALEKS